MRGTILYGAGDVRFAEVAVVTLLGAAGGVIGAFITTQLMQRTIDIGIERRCIDFLLQVRIRDSRYRCYPLAQLFGNAQIVVLVVADRADVDLRRQAEIEDLGDDVGRLKIECAFGKCGRQYFSQLAHIFACRPVALFQRYQDDAVIDTDG